MHTCSWYKFRIKVENSLDSVNKILISNPQNIWNFVELNFFLRSVDSMEQ